LNKLSLLTSGKKLSIFIKNRYKDNSYSLYNWYIYSKRYCFRKI